GGREPAGAVHRPLGRRHRRPPRGLALDEVRPRAGADPGAGRRPGGLGRGAVRRAALRDDPPRPGEARAAWGDLRGQLLRARGAGRAPAELHPLGLEGPLGWLAEQLEAVDGEQLEWLWDLAPDDLPRLARCVAAYERRYPRSERAGRFRDRLKALTRRRRRRA